jgi:AraC family ethanolamine operon transcriptional activator
MDISYSKHSTQFPQKYIVLSNFRSLRCYTDYMPENHAQPTALTHIDTDECAQLNEFSKLNGWEADYRQVGAGTFYSSFDLYASPDFRFTEQHCNCEILVSGVPPAGHTALFLPLNTGNKGIFQGKSLRVSDAAIIGAESEAFYRTPANLHMLIATIPLSRLERAIGLATDDKSYAFDAKTHVITLTNDTLSRLSTRMSRAIEIAEPNIDQAEFNVGLQEIEQDVITILSLALTEPEQPERGARGRRNRLRCLTRARDFIEANLTSPLGLETMSQAVGTSPRTLECAFRESLNVTVVQYIKNRRLIAINRLFLDPQYTAKNVSTLARAHGFNHMGRFARDYRALFGEYPSETLKM